MARGDPPRRGHQGGERRRVRERADRRRGGEHSGRFARGGAPHTPPAVPQGRRNRGRGDLDEVPDAGAAGLGRGLSAQPTAGGSQAPGAYRSRRGQRAPGRHDRRRVGRGTVGPDRKRSDRCREGPRRSPGGRLGRHEPPAMAGQTPGRDPTVPGRGCEGHRGDGSPRTGHQASRDCWSAPRRRRPTTPITPRRSRGTG